MTRIIAARCVVDIEQTPQDFHAYAIPEGVAIGPGDVVTVHAAPTAIAWNATLRCECAITVKRANAFGRLRARIAGMLSLTELFEVGFEAKEPA